MSKTLPPKTVGELSAEEMGRMLGRLASAEMAGEMLTEVFARYYRQDVLRLLDRLDTLEGVRAAAEVVCSAIAVCYHDGCSNVAVARRLGRDGGPSVNLCEVHSDHNDCWAPQRGGPEIGALWEAIEHAKNPKEAKP